MAQVTHLTTAAQSDHTHSQYLTTAMQSNAGSNFVQANAVFAGTNATGTIASNGLSVSVNPQTAFQFSNANGVTFGTNGSTVTATVKTDYLTTAAQSNHSHGNPTLALTNLSGTTASASNGLTLSLSAAAPGAGGGAALRGSGTYTQNTGTIEFANSNGITFGLSNNGTMTASHNGLTTAALSNHSHGVTLNLTNLAGTTGGNSNGIILSLSATAQSAQPVAVSGSNGSFNFSTVTFGNLNGLSFYTSNGSVVGSHNGLTTAAQSNHSHGNPQLNLTNLSGTTASNSAGFTLSLSAANPGGGGFGSVVGNGANGTGTFTDNVTFAAGNNITLSTGASVISIHGPNPGGGAGFTKTFWYPYNEAVNVAGLHGQASMVFNPVPLDDALSVNRLVFPLYFSNASNSTGTVSLSLYFGAYTLNASSLSLYTSQSTLVTMAYAGNNSSASQRGIRLLTVPFSTTLPQSRYYVGVGIRTSTSSANCTVSQILVSQLNSNVSGLWNAATNRSIQWPVGVGYLSASTTGIPNSIGISQIDGTNSLAARPPSWHAINATY